MKAMTATLNARTRKSQSLRTATIATIFDVPMSSPTINFLSSLFLIISAAQAVADAENTDFYKNELPPDVQNITKEKN